MGGSKTLNMSKYYLLLALFSFSFSAPKALKEKYVGGDPYHSYLELKLYADSTYSYYSWYHNSPKPYKEKGHWRKQSLHLILHSGKFSVPKGRTKKHGIFNYSVFRLKGDTLKMYSVEDSIKNYSFYFDYETLVRDRN